MDPLNNILTFTLIFTAFGVAGLIVVFLKRKYLPIIEYKITRFFKWILRTDNEIDLLIDNNVIARLEYNEYKRELWLIVKDKRRLIISPQYESEPEKLTRYLIENSNKNLKLTELIDNAELSSKSSLSKLVSDLRFTGELRDLFFRVSKSSIYFSNPITYRQFKKSKISLDKILS